MADPVTVYNAIVALPEPDAAALIEYRAEHGRLPPELPKIDWQSDVWRNPPGYIAWDVQSARLDDLDTLLSAYPDARIYGAWHRDTGAPARALRSDCIELMPDVVTYDDAGDEAGRQRPAGCYNEHKWLGQAARDWGA